MVYMIKVKSDAKSLQENRVPLMKTPLLLYLVQSCMFYFLTLLLFRRLLNGLLLEEKKGTLPPSLQDSAFAMFDKVTMDVTFRG